MIEGNESLPGFDPQIDANGLIGLFEDVPEWVAFAAMNRALGLSYSPAAQQEFLAYPTVTSSDLVDLEEKYQIRLVQGISSTEIDSTAVNLTAAFDGDPCRRSLHDMDAKVVAAAYIKQEKLETADVQLFKRLKDLGMSAEYVGKGRAAKLSALYIARLVAVLK